MTWLSRCLPVAVVVLIVSPAAGALIRVPADFPSIGEGVSAASSGDTVLVAPGSYLGASNRDVSFQGKDLVLVSEAGPGETFIDCQMYGRAFVFEGTETRAAVLQGFTIFSGRARPQGYGGGILVREAARPTIRDCVFAYCHTEGIPSFPYYPAFGGAIYCGYDAAPLIMNCTFYQNTLSGSPAYGSAVFAWGGPIRNCLFAGNSWKVVQYDSTLSHCIVDEGGGDPAGDNLWGVDPALCPGSYEVCSDSFALPDMNPWGELVGALGVGCAPCNSPVSAISWGAIKAMYR